MSVDEQETEAKTETTSKNSLSGSTSGIMEAFT